MPTVSHKVEMRDTRRPAKAGFVMSVAIAICFLALMQSLSAAVNQTGPNSLPSTNPSAIPTNLAAGPAIPSLGSKPERGSVAFWTGFVGIIFGACIAYFSDWLKESRRKRNDQHAAIMCAQLALISQFNTIENLDEQHLARFRQDQQRERKLISFDMHDTNLRVDYHAVSFLLTTNNPTLVLDVHAAEQSYLSVMDALKLRNDAFAKLHTNSQVQNFDPQTGHCSIAVKDPRDLKLLEDMTNALYTAIDRAKERLPLQVKELHNAGKLLYPKRKFLQVAGKK
jgi:hypothetical protein